MKKSQTKSEITASFAYDMMQAGYTQVPNLLLQYYRQLGLTDFELLLIIKLMYSIHEEKQPYPQAEELAQSMSASAANIQAGIASLMEKELLIVESDYCSNSKSVQPCLSLQPLYEELVSVWAVKKQQKLMQVQAMLENDIYIDISTVYKSFEKEFGRLLSPMETEKIKSWVVDLGFSTEMLLEALQRAILRGVRNCQYIDRILLEWQKHNLTSMEALDKFEQSKEAVKPKGKKKTVDKVENKDEEDEFAHLYLS